MGKTYTLLGTQPSQRAEADLVRYSVEEKRGNPNLVDPYNKVAPGLYPDETAYQLDNGEIVAISVEPYWIPTGAGVCLTAFGRWIEEDGSTKMTPSEDHIETAFQFTFNAQDMQDFGLEALSKEMLLVIIGESAELMRTTFVDPATSTDERKGFDPAQDKLPVMCIPEEVKAGANICFAIEHVKEIGRAKLPHELLAG